jgi:hypothetical protein
MSHCAMIANNEKRHWRRKSTLSPSWFCYSESFISLSTHARNFTQLSLRMFCILSPKFKDYLRLSLYITTNGFIFKFNVPSYLWTVLLKHFPSSIKLRCSCGQWGSCSSLQCIGFLFLLDYFSKTGSAGQSTYLMTSVAVLLHWKFDFPKSHMYESIILSIPLPCFQRQHVLNFAYCNGQTVLWTTMYKSVNSAGYTVYEPAAEGPALWGHIETPEPNLFGKHSESYWMELRGELAPAEQAR